MKCYYPCLTYIYNKLQMINIYTQVYDTEFTDKLHTFINYNTLFPPECVVIKLPASYYLITSRFSIAIILIFEFADSKSTCTIPTWLIVPIPVFFNSYRFNTLQHLFNKSFTIIFKLNF